MAIVLCCKPLSERKFASSWRLLYGAKMGESFLTRIAAWSGLVLALTSKLASAQQLATEHVVVLGTLPGSDIGLSADKVAGALQSLSPEQLGAQHGGSLLTGLGSQTAGVSLSDVQGNGLF